MSHLCIIREILRILAEYENENKSEIWKKLVFRLK